MRHLPQAGLCQACLNLARRRIAENPSQSCVLTWCPHRQTFANAVLEGGYVVRWEFASPVSEAQAHEIFRRQAVLMTPTTPLPGSTVQ
jgi:hypothetical protein